MKFINFDDPLNRWSLDKTVEVVSKTKLYADSKGYSEVELVEVEDNTWADIANQRIDITITYVKKGHCYRQKLLMLKGEILDGKEFHARFQEFYPERSAA